ncbi:MAG: MaoC family dehydratase [Pseudomonadota bacterium]
MKYLEDFSTGQEFPLGEYAVSAAEIIDFAQRYDPQVFHVDPQHEKTRAAGGLLASGWHTSAIYMRLTVDAFLTDSATLTSPGIDELRWLAPVRAGDILSGVAVVDSVRPSGSRPDRGILVNRGTLWNQRREDVMTIRTTAFVLRRGAQA